MSSFGSDEYVNLGDCYISIRDASTSDVRGDNLDGQGHVREIAGIEGQALGCSKVRVSLPDLDATPVEVDVSPSTNLWSTSITLNQPLDLCGANVVILAECVDNPSCSSTTTIWQLRCGACSAEMDVNPELGCVDGVRQVLLTLTLSPPVSAGESVIINWFLGPAGNVNESFTAAEDFSTRTRNKGSRLEARTGHRRWCGECSTARIARR
jgi:hypothetical protein